MVNSEIDRLRSGPETREQQLHRQLVRIVADCPGNAVEVLGRCKEVLEVILNQDPSRWPSADAWRSLLPQWFVQQSSEEISQAEAERRLTLPMDERIRLSQRWSVSAFTHWFKPEERYWFWWDSTVLGNDILQIHITAEESPFPWGALEWLLRASGATSAEIV